MKEAVRLQHQRRRHVRRRGGLRSGSGSVGSDDARPAPDPGQKKLCCGSRLWNGVKGTWGAVRNVTDCNLLRHGIGGAFRKSKIRKNEAKLAAARDGLDTMKLAGMAGVEPDPKRGGQLPTQFDGAERKLHYNRAKLGMHRKYRTGRVMRNEWSRLFTGREVEDSAAEKRYFQGLVRTSGVAAAPVDTSSASNSSQPHERRDAAPGGPVPAQPDDLVRESGPVQDDRYGSAQLNNFMYNDSLDEDD